MNRLMKWGVGALCGLTLLVTPVGAETRHVASGNRPGTDGTSKAEAYGSTFLANTAARANDRVLVYPGEYRGVDSTIIRPDSAGSSPGQIYYHGVDAAGAVNTAGTTVINGDLTINTPYTTLTNFHITGNLTLGENADFCRIVDNTVDGNITINGSDYTTVYRNTAHGKYFAWAPEAYICNVDSLNENTFSSLGGGIANGNYPIKFGTGDSPTGLDSCIALNNTFNITAQVPCTGLPGCPQGAEYWTEIIRRTVGCKFRGNTRNITAPAGTAYIQRLRDSTLNNTFDAERVVATGAGSAEIWWASSGNNGVPHPANNDIDSSYYDFMDVAASRGFFYQVVPNNVDITYTTILGRANALVAHGAKGAVVMNHDTFVAEGAGGVVRWFFNEVENPAFTDTTLTFTNNLVSLLAPFNLNEAISPYGSDGSGIRCGVYYNATVLDSADARDLQIGAVSNNNAYNYWGSVTTVGDRSVVVRYPNEVFFGVPGNNSAIEARFNQFDSLSVHGSAQYDGGGGDSTRSASFDHTIGTLSIARGVGSGGSDAGAKAYLGTDQGGLLDVSRQEVIFYSGIPDSVTLTFTSLGDGYVGLDLADPARADEELNAAELPDGITITDTPNVPAAHSYVLEAAGGADEATVTLHYDGTSDPATGSVAWYVTNDSRWPTVTRGLGAGKALVVSVTVQ